MAAFLDGSASTCEIERVRSPTSLVLVLTHFKGYSPGPIWCMRRLHVGLSADGSASRIRAVKKKVQQGCNVLGKGEVMASAAVFIADPKQSQERVQHENLARREGIDRAPMCDEIVGTSAALKRVLSLVSKVAPTRECSGHRRNGDGQRTCSPRYPQAVPAFLTRICECQLRCRPARLDRLRVVWP
jgi:hypothetical protein